jgi:dinuclear metal center YbgI/SA1388 family protein
MACKVAEIVALMEELAPPAYAEDWDNVGLQVGSREREVEAVLICLDVTVEVLAEAREVGAGMLVCHHPLFLRPIRRLSGDDALGALLEETVRSGLSVYAAHTNLDASQEGVNVALAETLGLLHHRPLRGDPREGGFKLTTFLPPQDVGAVSEALCRAGAGVIGDYTGCSFRVEGTGTFTPGTRSRPAYGEIGKFNQVNEVRLELVVGKEALQDVLDALMESHPYEEPACDVYPLKLPAVGGLGRVGVLPRPMKIAELAELCSSRLGNPAVRFTGDGDLAVSRVAVCGGSGVGQAPRAKEAGAQVLVTGDVGYHQAAEAFAEGLAIIDAGHYHTEWPVVSRLAGLLAKKAGGLGLEVEVHASRIRTCPWRNGGTH